MISVTAVIIFSLAVVMSGLFSGSETGMYQLSRVRLRLALAQKDRLALLLSKSLADRAGLLVTTLIGTNLSVHIATTTVTMMLMARMANSDAAEGLATLITTPILFVLGELLPKNLFLYRSDTLMPLVAPVLYGTDKALRFCGIVPLLKLASGWLARLTGTPNPSKLATESLHRHEMGGIIKDTQEEGFLTGTQTGIMNRLMVASTTPIKAVMTRITAVRTVTLQHNREQLMALLPSHPYTRLLVREREHGEVLGYINVYQCLGETPAFDSLETLVQPIRRLDGDLPVTSAIDLMQREKLKIVLVTRSRRKEQGKAIGILTMKDLAEELLGELAVW